jgi:hypothetical protein
MQLLLSLFGGLLVHSTYRWAATFSSSFTVYRLAFGVWRLAFGVWRSHRTRPRRRPRPRKVPVPFHAIARLQRLEGSRFTPLQVLAVRPEETNPELPDGVASRRLPGTSPTLGSTHPPEQRDNLEDEDDDEYEDDY